MILIYSLLYFLPNIKMHGLWGERWAKHLRLANVAHFDRLLCITWLIITMRTGGEKSRDEIMPTEGNECSINLLIIFWINWADFCFLDFFSTTLICFTYSEKKKMFKIFSKLSSRPYDIISGVNTLFRIFLKCIYIYIYIFLPCL